MVEYSYLKELSKDEHQEIINDIKNTLDEDYLELSFKETLGGSVYLVDQEHELDLIADMLEEKLPEGIYRVGDNYVLVYFVTNNAGGNAYYIDLNKCNTKFESIVPCV
jgi:hypothetical protein